MVNIHKNFLAACTLFLFCFSQFNNNAFFQKAAELEYLALQDNPEASALQRAYADVEQKEADLISRRYKS